MLTLEDKLYRLRQYVGVQIYSTVTYRMSFIIVYTYLMKPYTTYLYISRFSSLFVLISMPLMFKFNS